MSKNNLIKLELLAPAKDLNVGKLAIQSGADAVYIGAPKFGARVNAGNSLNDIAELVKFAHQFSAKVYVVLNTIMFDNELPEAQKIIERLYHDGVDALIIQDMGLLELDLPPIPLFASTQTDNRTPEKVKFLEDVGFERVILARELSLDQIKNIRKETKVDLETFVQGALCVSYSGQCYFSQAVCDRSANRGACCQACRFKFDLEDANGKVISKNKYLLSLKDFNLSDYLEELVKAGITSFKIEGRLKDADYVINNVFNYRKKLDDLIAKFPKKYAPASAGKVTANFQPDPEKTFNRGFTTHNLLGRSHDVLSPNTQKSMGKFMGVVTRVGNNCFEIDETGDWHNGDGICWLDSKDELKGVNINEVKDNRLYPNNLEGLFVGAKIYRNWDAAFEKTLANFPPERRIGIEFLLSERKDGFSLLAKDEEGNEAEAVYLMEKQLAKNEQMARENVEKQLSKLGDSIYSLIKIKTGLSQPYFFALSDLNKMRRMAVDKLTKARVENYQRLEKKLVKNNCAYFQKDLDFTANVSNVKAEKFYRRHGVKNIEPAFEAQSDYAGKKIMTTKHCIKDSLGMCPKLGVKSKFQEPFYLVNEDKKFRLRFDCENCQMEVFNDD